MTDIPIAEALSLWNSGTDGDEPAFAVRPLGHDDYYRYQCQNGACLRSWRDLDTLGQKLQLMIEAWHIAVFYLVPAKDIHEALLVIPEYRDMLADDCLPKQFWHERE